MELRRERQNGEGERLVDYRRRSTVGVRGRGRRHRALRLLGEGRVLSGGRRRA
jgi:hypothetical protein